MVDEISRMAKKAFSENLLARITEINDLPKSDLINTVLILGPDKRFYRMAVRQLNGNSGVQNQGNQECIDLKRNILKKTVFENFDYHLKNSFDDLTKNL